MEIRHIKILKGALSDNVWRVNLAVTNRCNSRCIMCNVWKNINYTDETSIDDYKRFFRNMTDLRWLHITGGEPFLRKDLGQIIKCAIESCHKLSVIDFATNGFNVDSKKIERLIKSYPSVYFEGGISIDGRPHIHEYIRNVEGCWGKVMKTWDELKDISSEYDNFKIHANFTISPWNTGEIKYFLEAFPSIFPISVSIYHKGSSFDNMKHDISSDFYENVEKDITWLLYHGKTTGLVKKLFLKLALQYLKDRSKQILPCEAGKSSFFVDPKGDVYICSIGNYKIGNIKEDPQLKFIVSNSTKELEYKIQNGLCNCWSGCECWPSILKHLPTALIKSYNIK